MLGNLTDLSATIQTPTATQTATGAAEFTWSDVATYACSMRQMSGDSVPTYKSDTPVYTYRFYFDYFTGLTESHRIKYNQVESLTYTLQRFELDNETYLGAFRVDDPITGSDSGATGTIYSITDTYSFVVILDDDDTPFTTADEIVEDAESSMVVFGDSPYDGSVSKYKGSVSKAEYYSIESIYNVAGKNKILQVDTRKVE